MRMLRSVLVASEGSVVSVEYYASRLSVNYREVIVAGEYVEEDGELSRVRDLSMPLDAEDE
jgi:hypothetical protein